MSLNTGIEHSVRHGGARLKALILGSEPQVASSVAHGLMPAAVHLFWGGIYTCCLASGSMSRSAWLLMLITNVVGVLGFYPWVRSGRTQGQQDVGLVLPQIVWGHCSVLLGFALVEPLRPLLLQALCWTQMFAFLSLPKRQVALCGGISTALLVLLSGAGLAGLVPNLNRAETLLPVALTSLVLLGLIGIAMQHSGRRQALREQKLQLQAAVAAVRDLATLDPMTGLYNRRKMQELLAAEHARAQLSDAAFAIAIIDLDHFKRVNDSHGHAIGDEVLQQFACTARTVLRSTDTLARWGGEEFLLLMPHAECAAASGPDRSALRVLARLQAALVETPDTLLKRLGVTFSAGIANHRPSESPEQTVSRADAALYDAKRSGRNRIVTHTLEITPTR